MRFGSSSFQHGIAVFEGIRCYATSGESSIFRLEDHARRLLDSARLLGIEHGYGLDDLCVKISTAAAAAGLQNCYLRPMLATGDPYLTVDLNALHFTLTIEVWPIPLSIPDSPGAGMEPSSYQPAGWRLALSEWRRPSPASFPSRAKATGIYVTSALAKTAATRAQYADAIQLDPLSGRVAEATSANIFVVRDGKIVTPWLADALLAGITRDSVLVLARELGVPAREGPVEVADLLAADEVFLTGTACELVTVSSVDDTHFVPDGPVFGMLAHAFGEAVTGERFGHLGWLTPVNSSVEPQVRQQPIGL
ncbi:MAG: aminotransferase class IV [Streptosporangiaceae bacterium]